VSFIAHRFFICLMMLFHLQGNRELNTAVWLWATSDWRRWVLAWLEGIRMCGQATGTLHTKPTLATSRASGTCHWLWHFLHWPWPLKTKATLSLKIWVPDYKPLYRS
jgi:hypothetical protein